MRRSGGRRSMRLAPGLVRRRPYEPGDLRPGVLPRAVLPPGVLPMRRRRGGDIGFVKAGMDVFWGAAPVWFVTTLGPHDISEEIPWLSAGLPGGPRTGLHDGTAITDSIA